MGKRQFRKFYKPIISSFYMKKIMFALMGLFILMSVSLASALCEEPANYAPGEIIVGFYDNVTFAQAQKLISRNRLTIQDASLWTTLRILIVNVPEGKELKYVNYFEKKSIVRFAELNYVICLP